VEPALPARDTQDRGEAAIRPERFARLVTLASILIQAGRAGNRLDIVAVCDSLQISAQELRDDISVLNVVNFGAGSYVLYAELLPDGTIEVDPDAYSDSFARPARLLPVEAKALIAAIDLIGDHIPEGSLASVRDKVVAALGEDPVQDGLQISRLPGDDSDVARTVSEAIAARHVLAFEYYKKNEDELTKRRVEPYALVNGQEGWYVKAYDPEKEDVRHFRLDRVKSATVTDEAYEPRGDIDPVADIDGWLRGGEVEASRRAHVWFSPERARWERESRTVVEELQDGAVIVEVSYAGTDWLVRTVLEEAGDAVVLSPPEARSAVREAVARLYAAASLNA
jgi:proteasome accessory factor C